MDKVKAARAYSRFLREYIPAVASTRRPGDDHLFLEVAYRVFFNRKPDVIGRDSYLRMLGDGTLNRFGILKDMLVSPECEVVYGLPIHPMDALHKARVLLVQQHLPEAEVIVDLGGAAREGEDPKGALLGMGYPYKPKEIIIVDLPPDERMWAGAENTQSFVTPDGIKIRYLYGSMADLSPLPDASADLVFSGESIEHISEEDGDRVCREAFRVLKPGGYFCLDTPNAALTRIESPDELTHPEHQKEYHVHELRDKLVRWGFKVVEEKGVVPMPKSLKRGVFDVTEMSYNVRITDAPEAAYVFFIKAVKPAA